MRVVAFLAVVVVTASASTAIAGPDTLLGARNSMGQVSLVDDDGSSLGDGYASGLYGVPISGNSIAFAITGYTDDLFLGAHTQSGAYAVFVDVYDFFDDPIVAFSQIRTLLPGTVDEYSFSDPAWVGGRYNVYIDNTIVPEPAGLSVLTAAALVLLFLRRLPSTFRR